MGGANQGVKLGAWLMGLANYAHPAKLSKGGGGRCVYNQFINHFALLVLAINIRTIVSSMPTQLMTHYCFSH